MTRSVSIFGIGYVGVALAISLGQKGFASISVDIHPQKTDLLFRGISPIKEKDFDENVADLVKRKLITATVSTEKAVLSSDISFICVGTPSDAQGSVDISYIRGVIKDIAPYIEQKDTYHLVVIRSTVPPGTTKAMAALMEELTGKKDGEHFGFCMNPEFLREGSSLQDFFEGKFNIIGSEHESSAIYLHDFYSRVGLKNIHIMDTASAELFKYVNNWFHALKIGFANEVGRLCGKYGADPVKLMSIFVTDDRLNISPYYLRPGFAFGGYCLPKDVRAVVALANEKGGSIPIAENILKSNEQHIQLAAHKIMDLKCRRVGVAGLVFKVGTDDFRESPYLELFSEINSRSIEKFAFDKHLLSKDLVGRNKAFIEGFFAATRVKQVYSLKKLVDESDVVIIGSLDKQDAEEVFSMADAQKKMVFDLNSILKDKKGMPNYRSFM